MRLLGDTVYPSHYTPTGRGHRLSSCSALPSPVHCPVFAPHSYCCVHDGLSTSSHHAPHNCVSWNSSFPLSKLLISFKVSAQMPYLPGSCPWFTGYYEIIYLLCSPCPFHRLLKCLSHCSEIVLHGPLGRPKVASESYLLFKRW